MRILITNNRLDLRGGAESFVRDLALGLQSLGHSVIAYSSDLGERERLLQYDLVPVSTDLEKLPFKPDIIHAQHHLDAMSALTALPDTPAIYHCHGAVWRETPPKHPCIHRYLAMSRTLAERITVESNVPPENIAVFLNSVDLQRFNHIRELPEKPRKALFYNGHHRPGSPTLEAVREATARRGLSLDVIGKNLGGRTDKPEKLLPEYDVVFASGRSAIDAMASGCAVIVLGRNSCGPMVTPDNYARFREVNFSMAYNVPPPPASQIETALNLYDSAVCHQICLRLRQDADSAKSSRELVKIYEAVIAQHQLAPPSLESQLLATSRYLRILVPLIKMTDYNQLQNGLSINRASALHDLNQSLSRFQAEWRM